MEKILWFIGVPSLRSIEQFEGFAGIHGDSSGNDIKSVRHLHFIQMPHHNLDHRT